MYKPSAVVCHIAVHFLQFFYLSNSFWFLFQKIRLVDNWLQLNFFIFFVKLHVYIQCKIRKVHKSAFIITDFSINKVNTLKNKLLIVFGINIYESKWQTVRLLTKHMSIIIIIIELKQIHIRIELKTNPFLHSKTYDSLFNISF